MRIYSKFCVECNWPEEYKAITKYAAKTKEKVEIIRTDLDPAEHILATELWGNKWYVCFIDTGKEIMDIKTFADKCKKKPAKPAKAKKAKPNAKGK